MAKYIPKKGSDEFLVTLEDLDVKSDCQQRLLQNTTVNTISAKAKNFFKFEKEKIIITAICVAVIAIAVTITVVSVTQSENNRAEKSNTVEVTQSKDYSTDMSDKSDAENRLSDYTKTSSGDGYTTYEKDNILIELGYDNSGNITYSRYENHLPSDAYSGVKDFDDSMIDIGMSKEDVLNVMGSNNYIYHLLAADDNGDEVEIYRYGWDGKKELVSLTFINGELNRYSINSETMEGKADTYDFFS